MRTMTIQEFFVEEFNRMFAKEGRDVRIVTDRPRPTLVTDKGRLVVDLRAKRADQ
jgi:hypothetical protein